MTGPTFIGWRGGYGTDARLYECERTGRYTCRTLRPLPAGRSYQERAAQWVKRGAWQLRGLQIQDGWTLGGTR